jgi:L-iditol 2-dehydrogenase
MVTNIRKAAVLVQNGVIEVQDRAPIELADDEVEVAISRGGVCSSDIERGFNDGAYNYPLVMGHEIAGKVSATASSECGFDIGQRVAIFPLLPCFMCVSCKAKKYALCRDYSYYGSRRDGGFATHLGVRCWNLMKLPDEVSMDDAALIEPTAVVVHAIKKLKLSLDSKQVCVIGAGFLGLLAVMYVRHQFPDCAITLIDRNAYKLAVCSDTGVTGVMLDGDDAWANYVEAKSSTFSKVIEFVGNPDTFRHSIELCEQGGTIVWVGNMSDDLVLPKAMVSAVLRKELSILGSWNSFYKGELQCDWQDTINLMVKGFRPSQLVTTRISIDELQHNLQRLYDHKMRRAEFRTIKVMVETN